MTDLGNDGRRGIIDLDPHVAQRHKAERSKRLQVRAIPSLRIGGYVLLLMLLAAHNIFIQDQFVLAEFLAVSSGVLGYSVATWIVLHRLYARFPRWRLGDVFLTVDIFVITGIVYFAGAEQS